MAKGKSHIPREQGLHPWRIPDRVWRSDDPSRTNYHLQAVSEETTSDDAANLLDLVMRMSELALGTGASASEATAMALRIFTTYRVRAHVDITNTAVTVSQPGGVGRPPVTALRTVHARVTDYSRLAHLEQLAEELATEKITIAQARERFDQIAVEPRQYRWWVLMVANAILSASIAVLMDGSWGEAVMALVVTGVVYYALRLLGKLVIPEMFVNALAAASATLISTLVSWWAPFGFAPRPSIVVGASIVCMLMGMNLVSAVRDGLDGYYLTSGARIYESFAVTSGIVLGVMGVLYIVVMAGFPTNLNPAENMPAHALVTLGSAWVMAAMYAVTCYMPPRALFICGMIGLIGQLVALVLTPIMSSALVVTGCSAAVVAFIATWGSRRWRIPVVALVSVGIIPQVPGSMIYRGIYAVVRNYNEPGSTDIGGSLLFSALLIGVALAIGMSVGSLLARPLAMPDDRAGRLALLRTWRRSSKRRRVVTASMR